MNIQFGSGIRTYAYAGDSSGISSKDSAHSASSRSIQTDGNDKITISDTARKLMEEVCAAQSAEDVQKQVDAIKTKPAVERTAGDNEYLLKNDTRLAELRDKMNGKGPDALTADELSYMQRSTGMVNTMANLSAKEKALYDDFIAKGDTEAAHGLALVALSRVGMEGKQVRLPNGLSFDPTKTEVTAENVRKLFSQMFVDSDGSSARAFDALTSALAQRESATKST